MEGLFSFINNNWVISIITGLLVAILTDLWNRFRKRKEYIQKVKLANKEVFNSIKAFIPEDTMPAPNVLFSLQRATAKEYGLKISDLEPLEVVFDSLIKEVMDSSFLTYEAKMINCNKLKDYSRKLIDVETRIQKLNDLISNKTTFKELRLPLLAGIGVTMGLLIASLQDGFNKQFISSSSPFLYGSLIMILISLILIFTLQKLENFKKEENTESNDTNKEKKGA